MNGKILTMKAIKITGLVVALALVAWIIASRTEAQAPGHMIYGLLNYQVNAFSNKDRYPIVKDKVYLGTVDGTRRVYIKEDSHYKDLINPNSARPDLVPDLVTFEFLKEKKMIVFEFESVHVIKVDGAMGIARMAAGSPSNYLCYMDLTTMKAYGPFFRDEFTQKFGLKKRWTPKISKDFQTIDLNRDL